MGDPSVVGPHKVEVYVEKETGLVGGNCDRRVRLLKLSLRREQIGHAKAKCISWAQQHTRDGIAGGK